MSCAFLVCNSKRDKPAHFKGQQDKKVVVLGLLALLGMPDAALPAEIAAGLPQLLSGLIRLLMDLKTQQENAAAAAEDDEEDEPEEVRYAIQMYWVTCCHSHGVMCMFCVHARNCCAAWTSCREVASSATATPQLDVERPMHITSAGLCLHTAAASSMCTIDLCYDVCWARHADCL